MPDLRGLPKSFIFGASTAAYQIEGAWNQDGKGPSIWDHYFHESGVPAPGADNGDVACDHYNRWPEDVRLMKKLNLDAYRFSLSWSRVLPDGRGRVNQAGMDFYDKLVDGLLAKGIDPFVTLYHWDLPMALQRNWRGWLHRDTGSAFADYAALMVKRLGDRVKHWSTFNEPEVIIAGYTGKSLAPAENDPENGFQAGHNLLLAHGQALQALRACRSDGQYGIVLNFVPIDPVDADPETALAASRRWQTAYSWYLDGILKAHYPDAVFDKCSQEGSQLYIRAGDMALISQAIDFLGINFYTRFIVDRIGQVVRTGDAQRTQMDWEIHPASFDRMLIAMNEQYELPPIYITENGAALDDILKGKRVSDAQRIQYLHDHLGAVAKAVRKGVDVRGYFVWSLMDNLEWSLGFAKTFGLVHVNRQSMARTVKDSGWWYRDVIRKFHSNNKS
jgi:beta-glucosidase